MNFNESIEELAVTLNTDCVITGENPEERQSFIDRFQTNESKIIICNAQAGGEGISLHDTNRQASTY
jgi:SNF2 family DNA or RNA helicase